MVIIIVVAVLKVGTSKFEPKDMSNVGILVTVTDDSAHERAIQGAKEGSLGVPVSTTQQMVYFQKWGSALHVHEMTHSQFLEVETVWCSLLCP